MRTRAIEWTLLVAAAGAACVSVPRARAEGWVAALSELRPAASDLNDPQLRLAERLVLARTLGAYGPAADVVPLLLATLAAPQDPALRDEILLALARRAPVSAAAPLAAQLAEGKDPTPMRAMALAEIGTRPALRALVDALGRPEAGFGVERALLRAGAPAAQPLAAALDGPSATRAARLLARFGTDGRAAAPQLVRALLSPAPELRAAAAQALAAVQAESAADALLARLADPAPEVVQAALLALAELGREQHGARLAAYLARAPAAQRPLALFALARAAPQRAVAPLKAALAGSDRALRERALSALESAEQPSAVFVPLLATLFAAELREATASALARVAEGAGLSALLVIAERSPDTAARAARAVAIAARTFEDALAGDEINRAHDLLRSLPRSERALVLRALARDPELAPELPAALRAKGAGVRASAAHALALLGVSAAEPALPALRAALVRERDAEAARRMLFAAQALGLQLALPELWPRLRAAATAPEAMAALAAEAEPAAPGRALRVYLRRALTPPRAGRTRAAAALALAALGDEAALPALCAALADPAPRVRLAAIHALARLGGGAAVRALRDHARIERDEQVRDAALVAAGHGGVAQLPASGSRVLEVRTAAAGEDAAVRPLLNVQLEDGRWLRLRALPGGELILGDLPAGAAEIRRLD